MLRPIPVGRTSHSVRTRLISGLVAILIQFVFVIAMIETRSAPGFTAATLHGDIVVDALLYRTESPPPKTPEQKQADLHPRSERPLPSEDPSRVKPTDANDNEPAVTLSQARPAPDAVAVMAPTTTSPNLASDFQQQLVDHIQPFQHYPNDPTGQHPQGTVEVIFAMNRAGQVLGVWVAKSSGYRVLDQEAVATIQRASPLPPIPAELPDPLNITVPVRFGPPA